MSVQVSKTRPSEIIAHLRAEVDDLTAYCNTLKGALAAQGCTTFERLGSWSSVLTTQECALVGALIHAHPRTVSQFDLLECMPGHDHVTERRLGLVVVKVCHIRQKLGHQDAIVAVRGRGYALGPWLAALIAKGC